MTTDAQALEILKSINALARFNTFLGLEIVAATKGTAEIAIDWNPELGQYAGFLHAGVVAALLDTVCGFATVTTTGPVLTSQFSTNCLRPAVGNRFIARGTLIKPGKSQCFARGELYAQYNGGEKLVATGDAVLLVT